MNVFAPKSESMVTRRQAFKIGGLTVTLAALVAACGEDLQGDTAPGRVGYAPPITDPPEYVVDDAVLLRTASSLEYSAIAVYEQALEIGGLDDSGQALVERLIANHQAVADEMGALTEAEGGVAWECTNPWLVDRLLTPVLRGDQDERRPDPRRPQPGRRTREPCSVDAPGPVGRVVVARRQDGHAGGRDTGVEAVGGDRCAHSGRRRLHQPGVIGEGVPTDPSGVPYTYSITSRFGSVGQAELIVGAPDENGGRESFTLQTPAANSFVYNELEPSC